MPGYRPPVMPMTRGQGGGDALQSILAALLGPEYVEMQGRQVPLHGAASWGGPGRGASSILAQLMRRIRPGTPPPTHINNAYLQQYLRQRGGR